jgi:hypothetical protein
VTRLTPKDRWARSVLSDDGKMGDLVRRSPRLKDLPHLRDALARAVKGGQYFAACCVCSAIGELVYAILDPKQKADKFPAIESMRIPSSGPRNVTHKRNARYLVVAALRHTCFHPAMASPMRELPKEWFPDMASLHTADAVDWALEQLDEALRFDLGER